MRSWFSILLFAMIPALSFGVTADFQKGIEEAKKMGGEKNKTLMSDLKSINPGKYFQQYTEQPVERKYYSSGEGANADGLLNDGWGKRDTLGKGFKESIEKRPQYEILNSDPDISKSNSMQSEADRILHQIKNQYSDCQEEKKCETKFVKKYCHFHPVNTRKICTKKLHVEIVKNKMIDHFPVSVILYFASSTKRNKFVFSIDGEKQYTSAKIFRLVLDKTYPLPIDCSRIASGHLVSVERNIDNKSIDFIEFPSCKNVMNFSIELSGSNIGLVKLNFDIGIVKENQFIQENDRWESTCENDIKGMKCELMSTICGEKGTKRMIDNVEIKRDCWHQSLIYNCKSTEDQSDCDALKNSGCVQIGSECDSGKDELTCMRYKQAYRCSLNECTYSNVTCGNGQIYCIGGECAESEHEKSAAFNQSVSALSVLNTTDRSEMKKGDYRTIKVFSGHSASCTEKAFGFSDCCDFNGWGQDLNLAHCSDSEKKLQQSYRGKRVIFVGRYCSDDIFGICTEHSKKFCEFNSKLGKILQEQGRSQIGKSFGSGEYPDCDGFTPEELQRIDLSRIDFGEFIEEIKEKTHVPDLNKVKEAIERQVKQMEKDHRSHV